MRIREKKTFKPREKSLVTKKKFCRFCKNKISIIDYKDMKLLESFIRERGKILSSRYSGTCARHQRRVADAIGKARFISLLPYVRYA